MEAGGSIYFISDFGISGQSVGGSNQCSFRFTDPSGSFNSPRFPANVCSSNQIAFITAYSIHWIRDASIK